MYPGLLANQTGLEPVPSAEIWVGAAWHGGVIVGMFTVLGLSNRTWRGLAGAGNLRHRWLPGLLWGLVIPGALAAVCVGLALLAARLAPSPISGQSYAGVGQVVPAALLVLAAFPAALAVRRIRSASSAERWAFTAAVVAAATMGLGVVMGQRYSLGWDAHWVLGATSGMVLAMALVFELLSESRSRQIKVDFLRRAITEKLSQLDPGAPLRQTADAICAELVKLPGVDFAQLVRLEGIGAVFPVAASASEHKPCRQIASVPLPRLRGRDLKERALSGAFVESPDSMSATDDRVERYLESLREAGVQALAHAPIEVDKRLSWVISVGRGHDFDGLAAVDLGEALPVLTDVAAVAGILLAPAVRSARATAKARREIKALLSRHGFRPVFQPVMTAARIPQVIGHEALTRFDNGVSPEARLRFGGQRRPRCRARTSLHQSSSGRGQRPRQCRYLAQPQHLSPGPDFIGGRSSGNRGRFGSADRLGADRAHRHRRLRPGPPSTEAGKAAL